MSQSQEISWTVCSCTFVSHTTKRTLATRSASSTGHEYLLKYGTSFREVCGKAKNVKTRTMCSTENNAELQTTCKWRMWCRNSCLRRNSESKPSEQRGKKCGMWPLSESDVSVRVNLLPFSPPPVSDPNLILELKTRRPPSLEGRAGCETWSVDFSPDGAWFAWSMGYGIVWVVAWPLDSE